MNSRVNTRRADFGLPQFDLPPAEPVFSPNPVAELAIINTGISWIDVPKVVRGRVPAPTHSGAHGCRLVSALDASRKLR